jgi:hypothetical protein
MASNYPHFIHLAKIMIESYGSRALQIVEQRVADNSRLGNGESAQFWRHVALAIRETQPGPEAA